MRDELPDWVHKQRLNLLKLLNEKRRREYLAKFREYFAGEESDKEQRECESDSDLTSLTDGELDDKIHKKSFKLFPFWDQLPDRDDKFRDFSKHLTEKKRRLDLAEVCTSLENPKERFLVLLDGGLTNVFESKRAYILPQGRNSLNEK
ncbi:hypothetical protein SUGI_0262430 [Cryptomeria japonica]|nr:hypothetical protein SUGI_0262430 [Cryptomeria japonica]